jgi:ribosomal protein L37AE/L43A
MKEITWEDMLITGNEEYPCSNCKIPTKQFDISFECPCCSVDCSKAMWEEYVRAEERFIENIKD